MTNKIFENRERPFKVPQNYFDEFEERFMKKIGVGESHENNVKVSVISAVKPWLGMAAGFILIAIIYHQAPRLFKNEEKVSSVQQDDDSFINSLAFLIDENDINELILNEDSTLVLPPDTFFLGSCTEEELMVLTYFQ